MQLFVYACTRSPYFHLHAISVDFKKKKIRHDVTESEICDFKINIKSRISNSLNLLVMKAGVIHWLWQNNEYNQIIKHQKAQYRTTRTPAMPLWIILKKIMNACKRNDSIKKGLLKFSAIQQAITVRDKYLDIFCKVHNLQQTFLE